VVAEFLTSTEVAEILRVSDQTIVGMCKRGELDSVKVGKQYRIYKDAVEQWIKRPIDEKGETE